MKSPGPFLCYLLAVSAHPSVEFPRQEHSRIPAGAILKLFPGRDTETPDAGVDAIDEETCAIAELAAVAADACPANHIQGRGSAPAACNER